MTPISLIAAIENKEEYEDMTEELTDRFGNRRKCTESSGCCRTESAGALCVCDGAETDGRFGTSHLQQHAKIDGADSGAAAEIPRRTEIQMESLAFVYTPRRRNSKEKIDLLEKSHALVEDLLQITQE